MEDERREHVAKMKKMEAEMEQVFEMKVKEKKHKLKESEIDVGLTTFYRKKYPLNNFFYDHVQFAIRNT